MSLADFATRWFMAVYPALGLLLISAALMIRLRREAFAGHVLACAGSGRPPALWVQGLRSMALLGVVSLGLSGFSPGWIDSLFSAWILLLILILGRMLAGWEHTRAALRDPVRLDSLAGTASTQLAVMGVVLFMLLLEHVSGP